MTHIVQVTRDGSRYYTVRYWRVNVPPAERDLAGCFARQVFTGKGARGRAIAFADGLHWGLSLPQSSLMPIEFVGFPATD